jgi:hypothetical protein
MIDQSLTPIADGHLQIGAIWFGAQPGGHRRGQLDAVHRSPTPATSGPVAMLDALAYAKVARAGGVPAAWRSPSPGAVRWNRMRTSGP